MLVFASAGLDSMVKHVVEDALPVAITLNPELREGLRVFVERRLRRDEQLDHHFLSNVLVADNPMERMLAELVKNLTLDSMQSVEQLSRVCSYFAVSIDELGSSVDVLRQIFETRNEIVHEMDVDMSIGTGDLRLRRRDDMVDATNELLGVAAAFLGAVDAKLA